MTVTLSEFRRKCSVLLTLAKETHQTIQITRFGKPLADIKPPGPSAAERAARQARDVELLAKYADEMNAQAEEDLAFYDVPKGYVLKKIRARKKKRRRQKGARSGATSKP